MDDSSIVVGAVKYIGVAIVGMVLSIFGFLGKKVASRQDMIEDRQNRSDIRIAVLESQLMDTKNDIKEIKESIEKLSDVIEKNMASLNKDIKLLMGK